MRRVSSMSEERGQLYVTGKGLVVCQRKRSVVCQRKSVIYMSEEKGQLYIRAKWSVVYKCAVAARTSTNQTTLADHP